MSPSMDVHEDELLAIDLDFERAREVSELEALVHRLAALRAAVPPVSSLAASIALREPLFTLRLREARGRDRLRSDPKLFAPQLLVARFARERFERVFQDRPPTSMLDLGLLRELCGDLERVVACAQELGGSAVLPELPELEQTLAAMRRAERPIAGTQRRLDPKAREGWFGSLANQQFETFTTLIGSPPSRNARLTLLDRIVAELERIRGEMRLYKPGSAMNQNNIAIVTERLAAYANVREQVLTQETERSVQARIDAAQAALSVLEDALALERAKHPALLETWATVPLIDKTDELRRRLIELEGAAGDAVARASALQDRAIALHVELGRVQSCVELDVELPTQDTPRIQLAPGMSCTRAEALLALERSDANARGATQGELIDLGTAFACFANAGRRPELSHFANSHVFRWLAPRAYDGTLADNALRAAARPVHLFVRLAGSGPYEYLGEVRVLSHGVRYAQKGVRVDLELGEPIGLERWRRYGGPDRILSFDGAEYLYHAANAAGLERWLAPFLNKDTYHLEITGYERARLHVHASAQGACVELDVGASRVCLRSPANTTTAAQELHCRCGLRRKISAAELFDRQQLDMMIPAFVRSSEVAPELVPPVHTPVPDPSFRELMERIQRNLEHIVQRLTILGYAFESPTPLRPLSADEREALARLAAIGPVPESLLAFWDVVGVVDLMQAHSQLNTNLDPHEVPNAMGVLGHLGPLVIPPPTQLLPGKNERADQPREVAFFPEDCLKAGFSGDYVYLSLPNDGPDFSLRIGRNEHELFTDYLKRAVAWGGFRGHRCYEPHPDGKDDAGYVRPSIALIGGIVIGLEPM